MIGKKTALLILISYSIIILKCITQSRQFFFAKFDLVYLQKTSEDGLEVKIIFRLNI